MASVLRDELALLFLKCGVMLANQVPLVAALQHAKAESSSARLRSALEAIVADLASGNTLTASMRRQPDVFDTAVTTLIQAAEETGSVDLVFRNLAEYTLYSSLQRWTSPSRSPYPSP